MYRRFINFISHPVVSAIADVIGIVALVLSLFDDVERQDWQQFSFHAFFLVWFIGNLYFDLKALGKLLSTKADQTTDE
jgi:membrane-bound ClpP family serine protease